MPFEPECIEKHRDQAHLTCGTCSDSHSYELTRIEQLNGISRKIIDYATQLPEWQTHPARMAYIVPMIVHETCMNAIEHGVLDIDKREKRKIIADLGDQYLGWVEKQWLAKNTPLSITTCINDQRILVGIHDSGTGFDATKNDLVTISDSELLELSGRGMVILRGLGVKLYWNKEGNTILCSYWHSSS